jgi:hypothetical protein
VRTSPPATKSALIKTSINELPPVAGSGSFLFVFVTRGATVVVVVAPLTVVDVATKVVVVVAAAMVVVGAVVVVVVVGVALMAFDAAESPMAFTALIVIE